MPATPRTLQLDVERTIRNIAGKPDDHPLTPKTTLAGDLDLSGYQRRALAVPLERAARLFRPDARVGKSEAEELKTCGKAVELVSTRAGFDGTWVAMLGMVVLLLLPGTAFPQRLVVRQNLDVRGTVAQPAFLEYTRPDSGDSSVKIGIGVLAAIFDRSTFSLDGQAEHLRNTQTDREQDHWRAGLGVEWNWLDASTDLFAPFLKMEARYRDDQVKDLSGWQFLVSLTSAGPNNRFVPNSTSDLVFGELTYSPIVGVMADMITRAGEPEVEGTIWRAFALLSASFFPAADRIDERIELTATYEVRSDVADSTIESDDFHPYFRGAVHLWGVNEATMRIGLQTAYVNGEDPTKGFADQEFWTVGLVASVTR